MRDRPSILEIVSPLVELRKVGAEFKGPCPLCGGTDRFTVFPDDKGWLCRKCRPNSGGVYDLIAALKGITPEEAMRQDKKWEPTPRESARAREKQKEKPKQRARTVEGDFLSEEWQKSARELVRTSMIALAGSAEARKYLASRGLSEATIRDFRLGYDQRRNAIVMPWAGRSGRITAVKFRVLTSDKKMRFQQLKGGRQIVFGSHLARRTPEAVIIEGEFNAMSIRQATNGSRDVFSIGGEGNLFSISEICKHYSRVIIWLDSMDKAHEASEMCGALNALYMVSPEGMDANDILKEAGADILREMINERFKLRAAG